MWDQYIAWLKRNTYLLGFSLSFIKIKYILKNKIYECYENYKKNKYSKECSKVCQWSFSSENAIILYEIRFIFFF